MTQVMAVGETVAQKYGRWGSVPTKAEAADPNTMSCMFVGEPGVGKTTLLLGNPDCLILHFDPTSLPHNSLAPPQAMVFPQLEPKTGAFVDANGSKVVWTWSTYVEIVDQIVADVAAGRPVPRMVGLDSMSCHFELAAIDVCQEFGVESLAYTDARKSYPKVYARILQQHARLRAAGRGVCFITHIQNKYIDLGDGQGKQAYTVSSYPDKFYGMLHGRCDFVLAVLTETTKVGKPKPGATALPNGTFKPTDMLMVPQTTYQLVHRHSMLNGITKLHVDLPDPWSIPKKNGWNAFRTAYMAADSTVSPPEEV